MSRTDELLTAAADALADGRTPLDHAFLVEHNVTADECFELAEQMENALRAWVAMDPGDRAIAIVRMELGPEMAAVADAAVTSQRLRSHRA